MSDWLTEAAGKRRCLQSAVLALAALLMSCSPQSSDTDYASDPRLQRGVSWQLAQHRSETLASLQVDYSLIIPAARERRIEGTAQLRFSYSGRADSDRFPLVIDFVDAAERVDSLDVNGESVPVRAIEDHLLVPADLLVEGPNSIVLSFVAGDEALNRSDDFLYTLFVPDRAHFSLPVIDQPNLKVEVSWELTVPAEWEVVANGPALSRSEQGGTATHRFAASEPIPSYLFAFATGEFNVETALVNGREMTMYHREGDAEKVAANREAIFALHGQALDWLEDYTQIDYPFAKFDFVLVPSFQYGGMEHPGSILYREASLFLDETATQNQILARASLIAHETAHMWFGDLVTMNWFDDVWTKEVFANFMAAKIVNPAFPEVDHELRFHTAHHPAAYDVDRTAGANPIGQALDNLRYAGTLYGAIIYQKAPIVMRHLENLIGEDALQRGLREYLAAFSYSNATWTELIAILDRESEIDLLAWNQSWVYEAGRPRITIEPGSGSGGRAGYVISQQDPLGEGRVWPQRLTLSEFEGDPNSVVAMEAVSTQVIELGEEPVFVASAVTPESSDAFLLPNASGVEYADFVLGVQNRQALLAGVEAIEPAVARGAAWTTLWEQVEEGRLAPASFFDRVAAALPREADELILNRLTAMLSELFWRRLDAAERVVLSAPLEAMLWREANSPDRTQSARATFYSRFRALATSDDGVARLQRLWSGEESVAGLPLSEADMIELATGLALRGAGNAQQIIEEQEARIENADRLARFRFVRPSLSEREEERLAFFSSLQRRENREREPWVLAAIANLHHPLLAERSIALIRPSLDLLEEIQETGDIFFPGRWLDATLSGYASEEAAQLVRGYLTDKPELSSRLKNKVLQSADTLLRPNPAAE